MLPSASIIKAQVQAALEEDVGPGDQTAMLISQDGKAKAQVASREEAILCGCAWFNEVFRQLDPQINICWKANDGERIHSDQTLCELQGNARALLTGERTALNYLQTLSATAHLAGRYAKAVKGTGVRILDTRKTLPGLRLQQKYAVTCGGCHNHRMGLYDALLIKENHILAAGSIKAAIEKCRENAPDLEIQVEVESLDELEQALNAGAHRILLDNFDLKGLSRAVEINRGRSRLEASGGITLENIRAIAETGIDDISVGTLTKDVKAIDLSMRITY